MKSRQSIAHEADLKALMSNVKLFITNLDILNIFLCNI